jgi:pyruvate kinase
MSALRPRIPILALTPSEKTYQQLALSHGVVPLRTQMQNDSDKLFAHVMEVAVKSGYVKSGDCVVITAGLPLGESGSTNIVKVETVE